MFNEDAPLFLEAERTLQDERPCWDYGRPQTAVDCPRFDGATIDESCTELSEIPAGFDQECGERTEVELFERTEVEVHERTLVELCPPVWPDR